MERLLTTKQAYSPYLDFILKLHLDEFEPIRNTTQF